MSTYKTPVRLEYWIRKFNKEVLEIERKTSKNPLSEDDFLQMLRDRDTLGIVAQKGDIVLGFMVYELYKKSIHILCLSVHPDWQNQDIGKQFLHKLAEKISPEGRKCITINVRETDLDRQKFLSHMGFRCVSVHQKWYYDTEEDAFFFVLEHDSIKKWAEYAEIEGKRVDFETRRAENVLF